jgi:hypothetical protein
MSEIYSALLSAYWTNISYKGAVVRGVEYRVQASGGFTCSILFELVFSPDYDPIFWMHEQFDLDKCIVAVGKKEHMTEFVFRGRNFNFPLRLM